MGPDDWCGVDLARAVAEAFGDDTEFMETASRWFAARRQWADARQRLLDASQPLSLEDWERIRDGLLRLAGPDAEG